MHLSLSGFTRTGSQWQVCSYVLFLISETVPSADASRDMFRTSSSVLMYHTSYIIHDIQTGEMYHTNFRLGTCSLQMRDYKDGVYSRCPAPGLRFLVSVGFRTTCLPSYLTCNILYCRHLTCLTSSVSLHLYHFYHSKSISVDTIEVCRSLSTSPSMSMSHNSILHSRIVVFLYSLIKSQLSL